MGIMDTVMGGVGTGVQPQDNPNPLAQGPSAAAQTADNSLPQPRPTPVPLGSPASDLAYQDRNPVVALNQLPAPSPGPERAPASDKDIDELFNDFQKQPLPKDAQEHKAQLEREVDDLFKDFNAPQGEAPIVDSRKPNESPWDYAIRSLPEQGKFIAAQMRAHLGRDPKEQRQAFESMYGPDNVKTQGGSLYFRPDSNSSFRKVDQTLYNGVADFVLFHALQAPGLLANVATQARTDAALLPKMGPAAVAVGGAAGGAVQGGVDNALRGALNQVSDIPQESAPDAPWSHLVHDVAKETGLGAVGGAVGGVIGKAVIGPVARGYMKFRDKLINAAGEDIQQLASVRTLFNQFKEQVFPTLGDGVGPKVADALDAIHDRMGKQVGAIKQEALGLAKTQGAVASMDNTVGKLNEILQKNGYYLDDLGLAKPLTESAGAVPVPASFDSALQRLASTQNRLVANQAAQGGSHLESVFADIDNLSRYSKFDQASPMNPEAINLFRSVRNAAASDRNAFIDQLYQGSTSPNASVWKDSFKEYSSNIDAVTDLKAAFRSSQQRELMINSLNKATSPEKLELLDNLKQVLGDNSKEWGALRGEIYSDIIDKHIGENGAFNASKFADYLTTKANQPFLSRVINKPDQGLLTRAALEASQISASNTLTNAQANSLSHVAGRLVDLMGDKLGVKALFKMTGGNAKMINYLTDDGFMTAYENAVGPEIKQNLLNARRLMSGVRDKMTLIPETPLEKAGKSAQRYVPLASGAAGNALDKLFFGFNPERGNPTQNAPGVATPQ